MQTLKDIVQVSSSIIAVLGFVFAVVTYMRSRRLDAAKWAFQLYEKFYEKETFKPVRDVLDCEEIDDARVKKLVEDETAEFTDYLNFFEFIAYLKSEGQVSEADVETLFSYYLSCLRKNPSVLQYVTSPSNGFEQLAKLLQESRSS